MLHGDITQAQRDVTINHFRQKQFQVLIATDVAARGIDVSDIDLVVQYRPPHDAGEMSTRAGPRYRKHSPGMRGGPCGLWYVSLAQGLELCGS